MLLRAESREALRARLTARESETPETLARRLAEVDEELADAPNNDYVVVNREGALEEAVDELSASSTASGATRSGRPRASGRSAGRAYFFWAKSSSM